ncbi:MAG TPA: hypothetical protein VNK03_04555 [Gammaproteobacteria bacterium]|nr:hypothetical protein [Gammaproteobacteria bacterium]
MESLVLEPTSMAQWHSLVKEARQASSVSLNEELESYLIFLLMRFINHPEMANSIFALDFLENIKKIKTENQHIIRDIGDKCLLYAGLFPGRAKRQRVQISYYVDLGRRSYFALSTSHRNILSPLFASLSDHFVGLMDILHSIRSLDTHAYLINLLEAEDLWHTTKSEYAQKMLKKATDGFLVPRDPSAILPKH